MNINSLEYYNNLFNEAYINAILRDWRKNEKFKYRDNPNRWEAPDGEEQLVDTHVRSLLWDKFQNKVIHILDMGCGNGRTIKLIKNKNRHVIGIDFSKEAIKLAQENNPNIQDYIFECDIRNTAFFDKSFDVVLGLGSFEHLEKIDFSEPRRLVRDDGLFIVALPEEQISHGLTYDDGSHYEWKLTKEDWIKELEKFNFKVIQYMWHWIYVCQPV